MFQDNDAITRDLNQLYEDITRRGRSFGVHLLLASQSLNINNINNRIYGFIPLRMAMQMDQTTANVVLAEGNTDAVELLDRSGRIIYNTEFGRKPQNQLGQIADVSLEARRNAMNHIHQQAQNTNYDRKDPIVIFQGNRPSKLTQNGQLLKLAKLDRWLPSSQLNKQIIQNQDWLAPEVPSALWIGEVMRIGHHTQAILRCRARSNMLLSGQSESNIFGMISGALLSLVHIHAPPKPNSTSSICPKPTTTKPSQRSQQTVKLGVKLSSKASIPLQNPLWLKKLSPSFSFARSKSLSSQGENRRCSVGTNHSTQAPYSTFPKAGINTVLLRIDA